MMTLTANQSVENTKIKVPRIRPLHTHTPATFPCYARCRSERRGLDRRRHLVSPTLRVLNVPNQSTTVNQCENDRGALFRATLKIVCSPNSLRSLKKEGGGAANVRALASLFWIVCTTGLNRGDHFLINVGLKRKKKQPTKAR